MKTIKAGNVYNDKRQDFIVIDNEYIDPEFDDNLVVVGMTVSELTDKKALESRLNDLISDRTGLSECNIDMNSINEAIEFLQDKISVIM